MEHIKRKLDNYVSLFPAILGFVLVAVMPDVAADGVRSGLSLCAGVIIPSLFPFFVLSGMLSRLGLPELLAGLSGGTPKLWLTPFLLGICGGYPVGAAALAQLVEDGRLSPPEAEKLLPACNNTGPAFIIGAAGSAVFGSVTAGVILYICHISAAVITGLIFSRGCGGNAAAAAIPQGSIGAVLSRSVKSAVSSILNVCGFVVFFSVVSRMLERSGFMVRASGELASALGLELHFTQALLRGLLELGGGIGAMAGLELTAGNAALAAFILGFGSLSVHCQTMAVTERANIKCARHFAGRIVHGLVSSGLVFAVFKLLQI